MIRKIFLGLTALLVALAFTACDTVTDLGEVSLAGSWDSMGALQAETGGLSVFFEHPSPDGTFGGSWRERGTTGQITGTVTGGANNDGQVTFTFQNYRGQDRQFTGRLTNRFEMHGDVTGFTLDRPAVFRFYSTRTTAN
ncbi:MAG: hypothetical protein EA422_07695 [Gemmatimonadales bacterium]|nr:MAG: hypothetical protein EA422_07695 [Gemmatimonadales bacterium]